MTPVIWTIVIALGALAFGIGLAWLIKRRYPNAVEEPEEHYW